MDHIWSVVQGIGALAGLIALTFQGIWAWRRRHAPRDIEGLRSTLDTAYSHVLNVASPPGSGTSSLDMVEDREANLKVIDMPRYSGRLADPTLSAAVHEAGLAYHLAFAIGTNLNKAPDQRMRF